MFFPAQTKVAQCLMTFVITLQYEIVLSMNIRSNGGVETNIANYMWTKTAEFVLDPKHKKELIDDGIVELNNLSEPKPEPSHLFIKESPYVEILSKLTTWIQTKNEQIGTTNARTNPVTRLYRKYLDHIIIKGIKVEIDILDEDVNSSSSGYKELIYLNAGDLEDIAKGYRATEEEVEDCEDQKDYTAALQQLVKRKAPLIRAEAVEDTGIQVHGASFWKFKPVYVSKQTERDILENTVKLSKDQIKEMFDALASQVAKPRRMTQDEWDNKYAEYVRGKVEISLSEENEKFKDNVIRYDGEYILDPVRLDDDSTNLILDKSTFEYLGLNRGGIWKHPLTRREYRTTQEKNLLNGNENEDRTKRSKITNAQYEELKKYRNLINQFTDEFKKDHGGRPTMVEWNNKYAESVRRKLEMYFSAEKQKFKDNVIRYDGEYILDPVRLDDDSTNLILDRSTFESLGFNTRGIWKHPLTRREYRTTQEKNLLTGNENEDRTKRNKISYAQYEELKKYRNLINQFTDEFKRTHGVRPTQDPPRRQIYGESASRDIYI